ncbi:MAG: hypothetical protein M5U09_28160 [Gammaproteobacteria bacterium]|nr:hypothetical protein [Gammaproteobacteria bacterium]
MLWSIGKDSHGGLGGWHGVPGPGAVPVLHIDTSFRFPENVPSATLRQGERARSPRRQNRAALDGGLSYATHDAVTVAHQLRTVALQQTLEENGWKGPRSWASAATRALGQGAGVRRGTRTSSGTTRISRRSCGTSSTPRSPTTPMFDHSSALDRRSTSGNTRAAENIPTCSLYFARDGQRYRSLGGMPVTRRSRSQATTIEEIIAELRQTRTPRRRACIMDQAAADAHAKLRTMGYVTFTNRQFPLPVRGKYAYLQ